MIHRLTRSIALLPILWVGSTAHAQSLKIAFRGVTMLPSTTSDQHGKPFTVAGLSGITDLGGDQFIAVMDHSNKLVKLTIRFKPDGSIASADDAGGISLADVRDFEGIAYTDAARNSVFLSEEGTPAIHEYSLADGSRLGSLITPLIFLNHTRSNFGFESLTRSGNDLWTCNEEALKVDGDRSTTSTGTVVRLLHDSINGTRAKPDRQYAYVTDPIHAPHDDINRHISRSGVSDLLALPNGKLLVLERSFAHSGPGGILSTFRNSIFEVDFTNATDISASRFDRGLTNARYVPVEKHALWTHTGIDITNLEGIALGPQLGKDCYAVVGVIDNNGNGIIVNRLVAFELRSAQSRESK